MKTLKILSLNCFESPFSRTNNSRITRLTKEILTLEPDILCLQEIIFSKTAKKLDRALANKGYFSVYKPGAIFNWGGLFFASKLLPDKKEYIRFKKSGLLFSLAVTEKIIKKGYQKIELCLNPKITILNTHLLCLFPFGRKSHKKTQAAQLSQIIEDIQRNIRNFFVFSGDFNFQPSDALYKTLRSQLKIIDPLLTSTKPTVVKSNTNRKAFFWPKENARVDYTLLSANPNLTRVRQQIIFEQTYQIRNRELNLSDHYAILTELKIS